MSKEIEIATSENVVRGEHVEKIQPLIVDESRDVGAKYAAIADETEFTAKAQRKYLRRIDMVLMPILFISYGLQYTDKSILSSASQFGIVQDLGLYDTVVFNGVPQVSLTKYSLCVTIYYWGYVAGILPSAFLAQRVHVGRFVGASIIIWGIVTASTAGVTSYHGLLLNRFFLGICESAPAPAYSLVTAMWYKREEQPLRLCFWYSASGMGSLLGGIAFYGIGHIHGALHPWRYQYLVLGPLTILWGCVVAYFLPDNPTEARFLTTDDRILATKRMRSAQTGIENTHFKIYQIKEAFLDPKTWILVVVSFAITLVNGALSGFGAIIIASFGFSHFNSILLSGATGAFLFVVLLLLGTLAVYFKNQRCNIFIFSCLPVIAGLIMVWKSSWKNLSVPLGGFFLLVFFAVAYVMLLSLMTANTAGHTKKAFTTGLVWTSAIISNAVGPFLVHSQEVTEHYPTLVEPLLAMLALCVVLMVVFRLYLGYLNKTRDARGLVAEEDLTRTAFEDMTDHENPNFRYSW